ncbi:hypothetical protein GCK72_022739 [Caenorhabditis remanei]|uniref:DNA2/NAM7 helicase-like C-terminal domain-containing protein n=1 Tax=Caenorhabditis remanei TaxID=31234 RepID=A0A6A5FUT6_CAERE|nr:hypothetical protein GCK72_022739 [Caenorhabditis remanei]KAF1746286.1 hypothetical protein GCK72_022739 [Caenorhabditis remanei]
MPAEHLRSPRCPFEVTATSSALFYQNRLTSIRSPRERSRFLDLCLQQWLSTPDHRHHQVRRPANFRNLPLQPNLLGNKTPDGTATADPDFIESPERLNVAITRTKSLCLVLVDVAAAGRSKLWSNLFCKIPPGAFHNNPSHLMRHLQTLH